MKKIIVILMLALSAVVTNAEVAESVWCTKYYNKMLDYRTKYNISKNNVEYYQILMEEADPSSKEYMELKSKLIAEQAEMDIACEKINYLNNKERWVFTINGNRDSIEAYVNPNTSIDDFIKIYDNVKRLTEFVDIWAEDVIRSKTRIPGYDFDAKRDVEINPTMYETNYPLCVVTVKTPNGERDIKFYHTGENIFKYKHIKGRGVTYYNLDGLKSDKPFEGQLNIADISGIGTKLMYFNNESTPNGKSEQRVVKSVTYYDKSGKESSTPWYGLNIVVTKFSDGSIKTEKAIVD